MPHVSSLLGFALVSLGMVLTPGPNMIYLISRSITQGPAAGIVSLGGVALGFVFYMLCAAFGITALLFAVPYAYDALRFAGAAYLLWLAWQAFKPGGRSPFQVRHLPVDGPRKLFAMGFVTNLLNPKIAMLYLALLPQFIDPAQGSVLTQSLALGSIQIVDQRQRQCHDRADGRLDRRFLGTRPTWLLVQRWLMGTVLAGLAVRMAFEAQAGVISSYLSRLRGRSTRSPERGGWGKGPALKRHRRSPSPLMLLSPALARERNARKTQSSFASMPRLTPGRAISASYQRPDIGEIRKRHLVPLVPPGPAENREIGDRQRVSDELAVAQAGDPARHRAVASPPCSASGRRRGPVRSPAR